MKPANATNLHRKSGVQHIHADLHEERFGNVEHGTLSTLYTASGQRNKASGRVGFDVDGCGRACNSIDAVAISPHEVARGDIEVVDRLFIDYLFSQDTCVFQSTNAPWGLSRHAQTCSSNNPGKP